MSDRLLPERIDGTHCYRLPEGFVFHVAGFPVRLSAPAVVYSGTDLAAAVEFAPRWQNAPTAENSAEPWPCTHTAIHDGACEAQDDGRA